MMANNLALQHLLTWLSPAFPVGTFAYSSGLETAISQRIVTDQASLGDWLHGNLAHGSAHTDAILVASAHRKAADPQALSDLADLCLALTPSMERHTELTVTGDAFVNAARAWPSPVFEQLPSPCPYPIAVGAIAAASDIECEQTLLAFLTAYAQTQISVAIRLIPLGQSDGLALQAKLETSISNQAHTATNATLSDIGSIGYAADIAAMNHETLHSRTFRS